MLVSFNKTRTKIERCQERQKAPPCCRVPSLPGCRWFTLHFRHVILQLAATQKRRDGARTLHSSDLGFPAWEAYRFWGHLTGHLTRTTEAGPSCRGRSQPSSRSVTPRARPPRPILSKRMRRKAVVAVSVTAWWRAQAASAFAFGGARTSTSSSNAKLLVAKPAEFTCSKRTITGLALGEQLRSAASARVR